MPESTTRKRDLPFIQGQYSVVNNFSGTIQNLGGPYEITGRQTTTSENHPEFFKVMRHRNRHLIKKMNSKTFDFWLKNKGGDTGGPFHTQKHEYWTSHPELVHLYASSGNNRFEFHGPMTAFAHSVGPTSVTWPVASAFDENSLRAAGATAISLVAPLNPQVSIATSLGELKNDGLPSLPGLALFQAAYRRERLISSLGSEFLNVMFGWKPTIADAQKLAETVRKSSDIIAQLKRDSGRPIRRHFDFPVVTSETSSQIGGTTNLSTSPSIRPDFWSSMSGIKTKTIYKETRIWFDGCFSYLLDPGDNAVERAIYHARIAQALYGVNPISPEVLWELTPYSWAVDWFTNTGDVIKNLSNWATSGQTLRWGYVMREERITHTYTLSGPTLKGRAPVPFIQKFTVIDKRRIKASPFGFQLEWDGFSNSQKAILAALGISRSRL